MMVLSMAGNLLKPFRARQRPILLLLLVATLACFTLTNATNSSSAEGNPDDQAWIGTWATAPQPPLPGAIQTFRNQTLRLIVHTSAGGAKVRIRISNTCSDQPLVIGAAHIARRTNEADIDASSDRILKFNDGRDLACEGETSHLRLHPLGQ